MSKPVGLEQSSAADVRGENQQSEQSSTLRGRAISMNPWMIGGAVVLASVVAIVFFSKENSNNISSLAFAGGNATANLTIHK